MTTGMPPFAENEPMRAAPSTDVEAVPHGKARRKVSHSVGARPAVKSRATTEIKPSTEHRRAKTQQKRLSDVPFSNEPAVQPSASLSPSDALESPHTPASHPIGEEPTMRDRVYAHLRSAKNTILPLALVLLLGGCSVSLEDTFDTIAGWFSDDDEPTAIAAPAPQEVDPNSAALRPAPDPFAKEAYCLRGDEYLALSSAMCYQAGGSMVIGKRPPKQDPNLEPKPVASPRAAVSSPVTIDSSTAAAQPSATASALATAKPILAPPAAFTPPAANGVTPGVPQKVSVPSMESLGDPKALRAPPTSRLARPPSNGEVIKQVPSRTAAVPTDSRPSASGIQPLFGDVAPETAAPSKAPAAAPEAQVGTGVFPQPSFARAPRPGSSEAPEWATAPASPVQPVPAAAPRQVLSPLPPRPVDQETAGTVAVPAPAPAPSPAPAASAAPASGGGFMRGPAFGTTEETILGQPKGSLIN